MFNWPIDKIKTENGEIKNAIAPYIISASRVTDIPAFHFDWFLNRIKKGYLIWKNPFNNNKQYISFKNLRVIVFWTKNPFPILNKLEILDNLGINYYFQYTLNNYENERIEPNLPKFEDRIETFKKISKLIGKEKVVWRFDPLIKLPDLTIDKVIDRVREIGYELLNFTNKLVYSYVDIMRYRKVKSNMIKYLDNCNKKNVETFEFNEKEKIYIADRLGKLLKEWKKLNSNFEISTCAEDIDLTRYGISRNKCIDDDLMIKLFKKDKILMRFLGYEDNLFNLQRDSSRLKDKGQRLACGCIVSKDIGAYNTCKHLCVYCYANSSRELVERNFDKINKYSECLLANR